MALAWIRGIATALFFALAATDTLLTATYVSGSWWLVLYATGEARRRRQI